MRRVKLRHGRADLRARRWEVVVLGGALPGLIAAARLGTAGLRVLVVEEGAVRQTAPLLREPFFFSAARQRPFDACLKAIGLSLVDRRALKITEVAYQVLLDNARVDVGSPEILAENLVAYRLASSGEAWELVQELGKAADLESSILLTAPLFQPARWRRSMSTSTSLSEKRGFSVPSTGCKDILKTFFNVQQRVLSGLGQSEPSPEARARLLGAALSGGAHFVEAGATLRGLLRTRIKKVHGEFRPVSGPFELVEVGGHPGIECQTTRDILLGRTLLINAPFAQLASALGRWEKPVPRFLSGSTLRGRSVAIQLQCPQEVVPEALAPRAILATKSCENPVSIALYPSNKGPGNVEIVARSVVVGDESIDQRKDELQQAIQSLLVFAGSRLERVEESIVPAWDDEEARLDPAPGTGWPGQVDLRLSTKPSIFALPRAPLAGLGVEGDLLLGWRAGETIHECLS